MAQVDMTMGEVETCSWCCEEVLDVTLVEQEDGARLCVRCNRAAHPVKLPPMPRQPLNRAVGPCPCECSRGGFCGGCGHAGCGGRRR